MRTPLRFLAGLITGFLVMTALYAGWVRRSFGRPSTPLAQWCHEVGEKKREIAAEIKAPKLLIVAGSSALFGISAEEIQRQLGCPTVNLGTHAGLGTEYLLHWTKEIAKPRDSVLLAFEYELYQCSNVSKDWPSEMLIDYITAWDPAYARSLSLTDKWNLSMLKRLAAPRLLGARNNFAYYNVDYVNRWGDQLHHSTAERPAVVQPFLTCGLLLHPVGYLKAFAAIAAFCEWARSNRIQVLATFPALCHEPRYDSPAARQVLQTIVDSYQALKVPVLGMPQDTMLPREEFFDTYYHLTEEAALERTRRLVPLLRKSLPPSLPGPADSASAAGC